MSTPHRIKAAIVGEPGVGKTTLVRTLPEGSVLLLDMEAGTLSISDWSGHIRSARDWPEVRHLICWLGGADPSREPGTPYSQSHYDWCCQRYGGALSEALPTVQTAFLDSLTEMSRLALKWSRQQPRAFSEKTGKPDLRGAYGLVAEEMILAIKHLQHAPLNVVLVGILERITDGIDSSWEVQMEGAKTGRELPGIVDEVLTLTRLQTADGRAYRAFVCGLNAQGYPAKDRSGRLGAIEAPHLGRIFEKIWTAPPARDFQWDLPE